jgi:CHAT domain-containing protein
VFALLLLCPALFGQAQTSTSDSSQPAELSPFDPEIRALLNVDTGSCKAADPDAWTEKVRKALQIADSRGLVGDRAVLEAAMASALLSQGKLEEAFALFQKALLDSTDAKREALEADILVSVSSEAQMRGNTQQAVALVSRALSLSERTGNLYGKARALGELGRLNLVLGKNAEAADSINEALNIDRLNGYRFEALHLVYKGYYLGLIGQDDEAIESLAQARAKAVAATDPYSFIMAENSYAFGLARKGRAEEAVRQMELLGARDLAEFVQEINQRSCLASGLELPMFRVVYLEGFTNVLEAANQKSREIEVWRELSLTSHNQGLVAGEAEAAQKIGNLEGQMKLTEGALKDYAAAADLFNKLGNEDALNQVKISESLLLVNSGRGKEAVPLVEEVASYAKTHELRELEFRAYITLAGVYQPAGDFSKAREVLEKATALIHPGPFDDAIDNQTVHLAYVSLSDIYRVLAIPSKELISIDRAFFVSLHLKDEKAEQREVTYLDQRLNELHIRDLAVERQSAGQLAESLSYSYVLYLRDGQSSKPEADPNWQRILNLPFQIIQRPGGAAELAEIWKDVGPMLGIERLPLLDALAEHYIAAGADPILAEQYATESAEFLAGLTGDQSLLKVRSTCVLAISYLRQGKVDAAREKSAECLDFAGKTHEDQTITLAEAIDVMVQGQGGNIAAAKSSLEKLSAKSPDNAELLVELATSLASAKLYDEANSQLNLAVTKLLAAGDKKTAAESYTRISSALGSDSSDLARKFQMDYLNDALKLFHGLGAEAEEASTLIALGDHFLSVAQNKAAIESYRKAQELAQKGDQHNIVAQSLLGLGNAYQSQKEFPMAEEFHGKAAGAFNAVKNSVGETISLRNQGQDLYELAEPDKALAVLLDARRAADDAGALNKYLADYFLGDFYRSQGQYEKALASFREAEEITTKEGDLEHSAYSHLAIASVDGLVGNWDEAINKSQVALSLFTKSGNKKGQAACWAQLTEIYSDRTSSVKDFDKAQEFYRKAIDLGFGKDLQLDVMEIYLQTGKYSEAADIAKAAIQDCLNEKNDNCRAHALISLSEAERLSGKLGASRSALNQTRPLASKSADLYLRGRLLYQESRLLASEGKLNDALASYERLISLIESVKGNLGAQEQKFLSENYAFIYDELVSLLYSMSKESPKDELKLASEALKYAEKNKARQFAESWGRVFKDQMRLSLPAVTQEREQALYSQQDRLVTKLEAVSDSGAPNQGEARANLETDISSVRVQIQAFLGDLRRNAPQYAAIAFPEEIQISNLPLEKNETLVEFKMTEDSTFVWIIRNQEGTSNELAAFYQVPKNRNWFLERLSMVRSALNSGNPDTVNWKMSEELFAALFPDKAARIIQNSDELVFIPDDVLFVLPFEVLSPAASNGDFPLLKKATTYYPSAVSLRLARTAKAGPNTQKSFLGVADPITSPEDERFGLVEALHVHERKPNDGEQGLASAEEAATQISARLKSRGFPFERLPGTATEVQNIASLLKERNDPIDLRLGANATKGGLLDTDLSRFRFIHFATHGVLPVDTGIQEPSLILSYDGVASEHMYLSMSEILNLKLKAESVVLSACNTGSGQVSKAEGVMSLGRAFLAAGAASVTVSLWQVSDDSTALLMEKYYEGILDNKKKSVALAEARYAVFTHGSKSPFFWAPFIVIGE